MALIEAITRIWSRIRVHHPEVPGVMLLAAPSSRTDLSVHGHFAPLRWRHKQRGSIYYHEVLVVAEHLDRSPKAIVETLLHEAAHALNFVRGIRDSTRSHYHNRYFRSAAIEVGLQVAQQQHYGYALTCMNARTFTRYKEDIQQLAEVQIHRIWPGLAAGSNIQDDSSSEIGRDAKPVSRNRKAVCACPFIIRVSKWTLDATIIRCENCRQAFYFEDVSI